MCAEVHLAGSAPAAGDGAARGGVVRDPERGFRHACGPRRHEARDAVDLGRLARRLAGEIGQEGLRDAAVLREGVPVRAEDMDVVPPRAGDLERAQVALADAPRSRVASLHGGRPGRERVAVLVAGEHGHKLVERRGAGRLAALDAGGRGLVLGNDQPEAARPHGVGDGGRAVGADAPHAGTLVRGVGVEAADGHDAGESVHRELVRHAEQGQRDRQLERARVPAGGQGRVWGAGGLEVHVGAEVAGAEPLQGVGDGGGRVLGDGVRDAGDVESSGRVGGGGHFEQVSVDAACVRARRSALDALPFGRPGRAVVIGARLWLRGTGQGLGSP